MLKERRNTNRKARPVMLGRRLRQRVLVSVLALTMFTFVVPTQASAFGQSSYGSGGYGYYCPTCEIYNHNETLVEDDLED